MTSLTKSLLLAVGAFAAGCAGMSDTDCRCANWYDIGEGEAIVYGLRPQIDQYAHQCSKHGVQVPETDYMAGWLVGNGERIRRAAGEGCCSPQ